jgi:hypothetical protein
MANTIQIKRTVNSTIPNSHISGGTLTDGELGYSYSAGDGSGDENGVGKLFIGHADGLGGTRVAAIIGGSYFTTLLDHTAGTLTASSAIITNAQNHIDALKTTGLFLGASGSAVLVTASAAELNKLDGATATTAELSILGGATLSTVELNLLDGCTASTVELNKLDGALFGVAELNILAGATLDTAELNKLDGVTATTAELNYVDVTAGSATASKAVVLDSNSHINTVKTAALHIGTSGSETQVTSTATELNLLDGITAIDTDLSTVAGTHTTLVSALAAKTYIDNTRSGLEVKDSVVVATTANITLSGTQTIDGIAVTAGQRVLVKDQTTASQNGIYVVAASAWSRATDADTAVEFNSGVFFFVEKGTENADNGFVMTQDTAITFGSTAITFSQFSGAGQITAGGGLAKSGDTLSVNTGTGITITADNVVIDTAWTGQSAINTVGTITTGGWNGTAISATYGGTGLNTSSATGVGIVTSGTWTTPAQLTVGYGGTGVSTFTSNGILYGNGTSAIQVTAAGADTYFLKSNSGTPVWSNVIDGGTF